MAEPAGNLGVVIEPCFLDSPRGRLFCVLLAPAEREPKGGLLYLHPFAEEMHKSRRMAALQARAFARQGYKVMQIDLTGCGDSAGDFGDADWETWKDDVRLAHAWLSQRCPGPIRLWGLRTGACLATEMTQELGGIERLLLWQPIASGDVFLNQFLRIKLAAEMLSAGQAQSGTKQLRARLEAGEGVEVGGYMLSPAMARALSGWRLSDHLPACPAHWLEISPGGEVSPASQRIIDAWAGSGADVSIRALTGEAFWLTQEITECPELLESSLRVFTV